MGCCGSICNGLRGLYHRMCEFISRRKLIDGSLMKKSEYRVRVNYYDKYCTEKNFYTYIYHKESNKGPRYVIPLPPDWMDAPSIIWSCETDSSHNKRNGRICMRQAKNGKLTIKHGLFGCPLSNTNVKLSFIYKGKKPVTIYKTTDPSGSIDVPMGVSRTQLSWYLCDDPDYADCVLIEDPGMQCIEVDVQRLDARKSLKTRGVQHTNAIDTDKAVQTD